MDAITSKVLESVASCPPIPVEFLRIPDATRFSGLCRSHIYDLIRTGEVRSVCVRRPGRARGVRLIFIDSLRQYIAAFENNNGKEN
jgi:hypothetical protein